LQQNTKGEKENDKEEKNVATEISSHYILVIPRHIKIPSITIFSSQKKRYKSGQIGLNVSLGRASA